MANANDLLDNDPRLNGPIAVSYDPNQDGSYDPNTERIPATTYHTIYHAYDTLNQALFGGALPHCLITLQRQSGAYGYFSGNRFVELFDHQTTDEIALNPALFEHQGGVKNILATLLHEMVHCWQHRFGSPGRNGYHNREWARKMVSFGLIPSNTGAEGGKPIGDRVYHYIDAGGIFDTVCDEYLSQFAVVLYQDRAYAPSVTGTEDDGGDPENQGRLRAGTEAVRRRARKAASKTKYQCGYRGCSVCAWAKPDAPLMCATHHEIMTPIDRGFEL